MNKISPIRIMISVAYCGLLDDESLTRLRDDKRFLKHVLRLTEINGLYYLFILRLKEIGLDLTSEERFNRELKKQEDFKRTLTLLNEISSTKQINHILIKSCIDIPHVPRDVDVLIHSSEKELFINALKEYGLKPVYSTDVETALSKDGYLKVDIYTETKYVTYSFLSESFLWKSIVCTKIFDEEHLILNNEANLLLLFAHSLYGHRSMTFLDFLQINHNLLNSNLDICENYASENKWLTTFQMILEEFNRLSSMIRSGQSNGLVFPYKFRPNFIFNTIGKINGIHLTKKTLIFLYLSLIIDSSLLELKKHECYDILLNHNSIRTTFNSFNYFVRHACGDTKSK